VLTLALQISEWILLVAAYAVVGLRLYTRLVVQREKLRVSEWVLIVAAIDALGLIICEYASSRPSSTNVMTDNLFQYRHLQDWRHG
jgi:hypothetical protein